MIFGGFFAGNGRKCKLTCEGDVVDAGDDQGEHVSVAVDVAVDVVGGGARDVGRCVHAAQMNAGAHVTRQQAAHRRLHLLLKFLLQTIHQINEFINESFHLLTN